VCFSTPSHPRAGVLKHTLRTLDATSVHAEVPVVDPFDKSRCSFPVREFVSEQEERE